MSNHNIITFLLLISHFHHSLSTINPNTFLQAECRATLYPSLCIHSLSTYSTTSRKQLSQAALSVSLARAQAASTFISKLANMKPRLKPMEHRAVIDCAANMANAVDQLSRSMNGAGRAGDVESWVAAALTFEDTCLDGFRGPTGKGNVGLAVSVTKRVVDCKQVTSVALALFHRYATSASGPNLP